MCSRGVISGQGWCNTRGSAGRNNTFNSLTLERLVNLNQILFPISRIARSRVLFFFVYRYRTIEEVLGERWKDKALQRGNTAPAVGSCRFCGGPVRPGRCGALRAVGADGPGAPGPAGPWAGAGRGGRRRHVTRARVTSRQLRRRAGNEPGRAPGAAPGRARPPPLGHLRHGGRPRIAGSRGPRR